MPSIEWLHLLLFPALLAGVLVVLHFRVYRNLRDVNHVFEAGHRSAALRSTLTAIMVLAVSAFGAVQIVRIPFLIRVVGDLAGGPDGRSWIHAAAALLFVGVVICEAIALTHLLFYLYLCRKGARRDRAPRSSDSSRIPLASPETMDEPPRVAILIPACDEPPEVLERSLGSLRNLDYPGIRCFLVENSRSKEHKRLALQLAARYNVDVFDLPNRGTKAAALNDARARLDPSITYAVVFDADQRTVKGSMLADLIPLLEEDTELAFVQTAQAYSNSEESLVTFAAAQQQMLVYDCLMEGKAERGSAPCFGTNFVIRLSALDSVDGWDEDNVTEDLSTSYRLQAQGWKSHYVRKIYANGLALPSLETYWRQQRRWASGNTSLALTLLGRSLAGKGPFSLGIDYLFSAGFYLQLFVLSALSLAPTAALVGAFLYVPEATAFGAGLGAPSWAFGSFYAVYVLVLLFPHINMAMRGYPIRNSILVHGLTTVSAPVYMSGVREALFRRAPTQFDGSRRNPGSTSRGPLFLAPQTWMFAVFVATGSCFCAIAIASPKNPIPWILCFWAFIHGLSVGHFFLLRQSGPPLVRSTGEA